MSVKLEIFRDLSVYVNETLVNTLNLENIPADKNNNKQIIMKIPVNVENIVGYGKNNAGIVSLYSQESKSGNILLGDEVRVYDKYGNDVVGTLLDKVGEGDNRGIRVVSEGKVLHIQHPSIIQSTGADKVLKVIVNRNYHSIIIRGLVKEISWKPIYSLFTDGGDNFTHLELCANIYNSGNSIEVNQLILSTRKYVNNVIEGSNIPYNADNRMVSASIKRSYVEPVTPERISSHPQEGYEDFRSTVQYQKHVVKLRVNLTKHTSVPLWSNVLNLAKQYYYFLGDKKIYYGCEFDTEENVYFPPGLVQVIDANMNSISQFNNEGIINGKVRYIVNEADELDVVPNIYNLQQNSIQYKLQVMSRKDTNIRLNVIYKVNQRYKKIISEGTYIENRAWGEIIWSFDIEKGENILSSSFTIIY